MLAPRTGQLARDQHRLRAVVRNVLGDAPQKELFHSPLHASNTSTLEHITLIRRHTTRYTS